MTRFLSLAAFLALTACATPVTTLRNASTGQVVTCGGGVAGSLIGGVAGFNIEQVQDRKCEARYAGQGFKPAE